MRTAIEIYGKPFSEIANYQPIEEDDEREHEVLLYDKPPK